MNMNQRLYADIACWTALISLLYYATVTVEHLVLSGVFLTATVLVTAFAVVYNGRNVLTVVRSKLNARRYRREEAEREAEYERERAARYERDSALSRAIIDTINRYS